MDIQSILPVISPAARQATTDLLLQLKLGQIIPATVIKALPDTGQTHLSIGGKLVQAQSSIALQPGQALELEVIEIGRLPQLKIVRPVAAETVSQKTVLNNIGLQKSPVLLPRQLIAFAEAPSGVNNLPAAIKTLAQNFLTSLPDVRELSTFQGIKQAIAESGIFLEAKLASLTQPKSAPIENDLKANLLRFAASVDIENPSRELVQRKKTGGPSVLSKPEVEFNLNRTLAESAKGAISKIILDQVSSLPEDHGNKQTWSLEIPFLNVQQAETAKLTIQREASKQSKTGEPHWSVVVEINPPNLGSIQSKIILSGMEVSTYFRTESEFTRDLIQNNLNVLRKQLASAGLSTGNLTSGSGLSREKPIHSEATRLVDQRV